MYGCAVRLGVRREVDKKNKARGCGVRLNFMARVCLSIYILGLDICLQGEED